MRRTLRRHLFALSTSLSLLPLAGWSQVADLRLAKRRLRIPTRKRCSDLKAEDGIHEVVCGMIMERI